MKKPQRACVTEKCNSALDKVVQIILPYEFVHFLNRQLIKKCYIYLNIWSIIHFCLGAIFFLIWSSFFSNLPLGFFIWLLLHTIWEITEFLLALKGLYPTLFSEEFVDIIWDTIISLLGYALPWMLFVLWR
ncbi:MAG: hypothetical protein KKE23_03770 [Nanoarchaeota archaeon]|nr:hypothetical protein [Nanoarchaeota archaeon]